MMAKFFRNARKGFTLVEIMIVVLIIGILLAIAVPNFIRARESSRAKACQSNLKQIDSAKEQWAMDNRVAAGGAVSGLSLLVPSYIKSTPVCPSSGTYTTGSIGTNPTCSVGGTAGAYDAHVLP
jgi:prepilin-type N-terminal cleavage/methylation domain-containing protein